MTFLINKNTNIRIFYQSSEQSTVTNRRTIRIFTRKHKPTPLQKTGPNRGANSRFRLHPCNFQACTRAGFEPNSRILLRTLVKHASRLGTQFGRALHAPLMNLIYGYGESTGPKKAFLSIMLPTSIFIPYLLRRYE